MNKYTLNYLAVAILLLSFGSCQKEQEKPRTEIEERLFNLEQSGWKSRSISHFFSDIEYNATLVPIQYYILKNEGSQDLNSVDSIYQEYKNERVIEVKFQQEKEDDLLKDMYTNRSYEDAVKYMAFTIRKDFKAVTQSGDTIACAGVTFERNFKVAPFKRLLLNFGGIPENETIQLVYDDQLFGNGLMKFNFKERPIKL